MKTILASLAFLGVIMIFSIQDTTAQCYRCSYDLDWKKTGKNASKALKKQFPEVGKVNWYKCELGFLFAVEDFGDSTYTYVFSEDKKWLGKETRYIVTVPFLEKEDYDSTKNEMTQCPGPNILPKAIWPSVAEGFSIDDLEVLNHKSGMPYWVCDIYKVELPEDHPVVKKEGSTTFYVTSFDHLFHIYSDKEEIFLNATGTQAQGLLYVEPQFIYE